MFPILEVKGLLGIEDIKLEIRPITILIGPQASGKSVIAKVLYFFQEFALQLSTYAQDSLNKKNRDAKCIAKFSEYLSSNSWANDSFSASLTIGEEYIRIKKTAKAGKGRQAKNGIVFEYSQWYTAEISSLKRFLTGRAKSPQVEANAHYYDVGWEAQTKLYEDLDEQFGPLSPTSQIFIPAGRAFFSNLQNNVFGFLASNNSIDPFLSMFGKQYENIKRMPAQLVKEELSQPSGSKYRDVIYALVRSIMCGEFHHEQGKDYIKVLEGRKIAMVSASSGQQEATPLSLMLLNLAFLKFRNRKYTLRRFAYIEEPEAHLFPTSQKAVIDLLGEIYNFRKGNVRLFITTHSPYVLSALNNLILASKVHEQDPDNQKIEAIVPKSRAIPSSQVGAFFLKNGGIVDLKDQESGLINASAIDEVSNSIATEFEDLISFSQ